MQNLFLQNNKFEAPVFIVICLVLLQYWAPQFKNQDMTNNLGTMVGSAVMVAILVLYLTDLDLTEALLFGLCYFVVFWVLTNYTKNVVGPRTTENFYSDSDTITEDMTLKGTKKNCTPNEAATTDCGWCSPPMVWHEKHQWCYNP